MTVHVVDAGPETVPSFVKPASQTLYFSVVQKCKEGIRRWITIPAAGEVPLTTAITCRGFALPEWSALRKRRTCPGVRISLRPYRAMRVGG
jgi:hypothetical protein